LTGAKRISIRAPAKINLGLTVCGSRPDGFHEIESVMQQVSLADILLLEPTAESEVLFQCTDPELNGPENLVCRAAEMLKIRAGGVVPGVKIVLYKNIPVGAGLAGGSADAASALKGLNKFWQLNLPQVTLLEVAATLGSDIPFCLEGGTALARGRGELLEKLPASPFFWVVLALPPGAKISTAAAYGGFDRKFTGQPSLGPLVRAIKNDDKRALQRWLGSELTNTLETAELPETGSYRKLKAELVACGLQPQLSGSGPTLFMLFDSLAEAGRALRAAEEAGARAYLCWTESE